ncbi:MAG: OmpA family protein [Candidatus Krumholzibacteriia bacterium]
MSRGGRGIALLACAGLVAGASPTGAESSAPGGLRGLLHVRSADTAGRGTLEFGVFSHIHTLVDDDDSRHFFLIEDLQIGYGVSPFLEIGIDLPIRLWTVDRSGTSRIDPPDHGGFGDVQASAKLLFPLPWRSLRIGALGAGSAPSGSRSRGFSAESTDLELGGAVTIDLTHLEGFVPTRLHFNGSYRWNRNETEGFGLAPLDDIESGGFWPPSYPPVPLGEGERYNDHLRLRSGVEFTTRALTLFTEFSADLLPNVDALDFTDNPVFVTQGALIKFRNGLNLKAAVDLSLQKDDQEPVVAAVPDWRLSLGITWRMSLTLGDKDHDGIPDKRDECAEQAEDFDGYEDDDGCPDLDNDGDGVADRDDLAPDLAEDFDGFEDDDGRPDLDNDGDGTPDVDDECPNEPEDYDGDQDTDGCPDVLRDADRDGVPDGMDRCPDAPEDRDGFEDADGCPDPDNDGDGIPDDRDQCPDAAETVNGFEDADGCPDSAPPPQGTVLRELNFASGSAELPAKADEILAGLIRELLDDPELRIEVRGYTDDRGAAARNLVLSERRAQAVRDHLLASGIDAHRVRARGLGEAHPTASNDTPEGRAQNRRIEVWRLP